MAMASRSLESGLGKRDEDETLSIPKWLRLPLLGAVVLPFFGAGVLACCLPRNYGGRHLSQDECRTQFPEVALFADGCQCLQAVEASRDIWELTDIGSPPVGKVVIGDTGSERGVGLFASANFSVGEEIGRALAHVVPCRDFTANTSIGQRTILCDTHLYPLDCSAASEESHDVNDVSEVSEKIERPAVFPEWLDFLNHAWSAKANTYYGPAVFEISTNGSVHQQTWILVARRNISAGEELTIDYFSGSYEFEALRNAFGLHAEADGRKADSTFDSKVAEDFDAVEGSAPVREEGDF